MSFDIHTLHALWWSTEIKHGKSIGPGKTRTHCGGNIVSCDVACPWQNTAKLLHATRPQEMFLKIFRNVFWDVSIPTRTHLSLNMPTCTHLSLAVPLHQKPSSLNQVHPLAAIQPSVGIHLSVNLKNGRMQHPLWWATNPAVSLPEVLRSSLPWSILHLPSQKRACSQGNSEHHQLRDPARFLSDWQSRSAGVGESSFVLVMKKENGKVNRKSWTLRKSPNGMDVPTTLHVWSGWVYFNSA